MVGKAVICFYHDDLDGRCAARWVLKAARLRGIHDITLVPVDYRMQGNELLSRVRVHDDVYIVDYSLPLEEMVRLVKKARSVVWIDHHISAIEKYQQWNGPVIPGVRVPDVAACVLTYLYLFVWTDYGVPLRLIQRGPQPEEWFEVPMGTKLIGDKDAWRWEFAATRYFCAGLEAHDTSPLSEVWSDVDENVLKFVEEGRIVERFKERTWIHMLSHYAFEVELNGLKGLACNVGLGSSLLFEILHEEERKQYDFFATFVWDGEQYEVSLYSNPLARTPVNVAKLAEQFGGGGHTGAAGFECKVLPFRVIGRVSVQPGGG